MQTSGFFRNHGVGQMVISQTPQATLVPWLVGSQLIYGDPLSQLKPLSRDHIDGDDQITAVSRQMNHVIDPRRRPGSGSEIPEKGTNGAVKFSIVPGNSIAMPLPEGGTILMPVSYHRSHN